MALSSIALGAHAQSDNAAHAAREAQARQKLEQVRVQIKTLADAQKDTNVQRNAAVAALRDQELKIAATAKQLRTLDQQLAGQQAKLDDLLKRRTLLDAKLKDQRDALAALLRSAYAMGRDEELKLLLAQDSAADIARMLAYYRYFERARLGEIEALLENLHALAKLQDDIGTQTAVLQKTRVEQAGQAMQLDAERSARRQALDRLDATLKSQQSRLAALGKDEKALLDLLAKLRDIFADIPQNLAGAEPFAALRGKLHWPLRGRIVERFGVGTGGGGASQGVLIAARDGSEVHAVAHGRVVFADWLRGYGLLLIVDHGDGYLSLYGYNETLLKDVGDWVDAGTVIATSGDSGGRPTPGLYFELRFKGKAIDPMTWLRSSR
ncbi:MAG: peptidoglycan DD-metalloendopeptidase family protein [Xanthomonadaceae bacterium]|nr:peptidoglycan DD-metalloendopeptidase family protein [Xanthomonadaceae bacterium]